MQNNSPELRALATFFDHDGKEIALVGISQTKRDVMQALRGVISRGTERIEVTADTGEVITIIYGTRERIDQYCAETGTTSPLQAYNHFDGIPGLFFMIDMDNDGRYEIDVPLPYEFGDDVRVENFQDDIDAMPREFELAKAGFRRVADLFDTGTDREGDYVSFMRAIQEARHLEEEIVVMQKDDHYILFIKTTRTSFDMNSHQCD